MPPLHWRISSRIVVSRSFSTEPPSSGYKQSVLENKHRARQHVLIENLTNQKDINAKLVKNPFSNGYLSEKLGVSVDHHWSWSYRRRNFILAHLGSAKDLDVLQNDRSKFALHSVPIKSRMIESVVDWVPSCKDHAVDPAASTLTQHRCYATAELGKQLPTSAELMKQFPTSELLIDHLTESNSLSQLDREIRYFLITQIEDILCTGVFGQFQVYPFGSSLAGKLLILVNGFSLSILFVCCFSRSR